MSDRIYVGTRKGLFELARRNGSWDIVDTKFLGDPVSAVLAQADGTVYAALDLGHFGAKLWRRGGNGEWSELTAPAFPPKPDDAGDDPHPWTLGRIWGIEPGGVPGRLWAGSMPGALFRSDDAGKNRFAMSPTSGSCGASHGANTPTRMNRPIITMPIFADSVNLTPVFIRAGSSGRRGHRPGRPAC